jgi:hypothetical protein
VSGVGVAPVRMLRRWFDWPDRVRRAVSATYLAVLTWALLAPGETFQDVDRLFAHQDKVAHIGLFLALAVLTRWSLPGGPGGGGMRTVAAAALALYAGSIEALQPLLSGGERLFEWGDLLCNAAGVCIGWLLFRLAAADSGREAAA